MIDMFKQCDCLGTLAVSSRRQQCACLLRSLRDSREPRGTMVLGFTEASLSQHLLQRKGSRIPEPREGRIPCRSSHQLLKPE